MVISSSKKSINLVLASPRGFCAGVDRAITIVEKALEMYGSPIYVQHEIVHNTHVVKRLQDNGVVFVENVDQIPEGAHVIYSAHGVSPEVRKRARKLNLKVLDATCPLVTKVHGEAKRYSKKGYVIILIGHQNHVEVQGTVGEAPDRIIVVGSVADVYNLKIADDNTLVYITQTTLSLDDTAKIIQALKKRFPQIQGPPKADICYATQNRQQAIRQIVDSVDLLLVVGAQSSSNSNRLKEIGTEKGLSSYLIDDLRDVKPSWLVGVNTIGITAGASAPEELVTELLDYLRSLAEIELELVPGVEENIQFKLPIELICDVSSNKEVRA